MKASGDTLPGSKSRTTRTPPSKVRKLSLTVVGAAIALALLPSVANAYVYWTSDAGYGVGRANLDGTGVDQVFISGAGGEVRAVAVDADHVYWSHGGLFDDSIARADLDGSNQDLSFISTAYAPRGVAVDSGHVYWTNGGAGTIARADLDGSNVDLNFISGASVPEGVAVDADHVY
jgi:hypothetical protein